VPKETEGIVERIRSIGTQVGCNLHHITLHKVSGRLHADLDLEVEGDVKLSEAHALSDKLEARIKEDNPAICEVNTHIDWRTPSPPTDVSIGRDAALTSAIEAAVRQKKEVISCRKVSVEEERPGELVLTIRCTMQPEADAGRVREVSEDLEKTLKGLVRGPSRVIIHIEPEERA